MIYDVSPLVNGVASPDWERDYESCRVRRWELLDLVRSKIENKWGPCVAIPGSRERFRESLSRQTTGSRNWNKISS